MGVSIIVETVDAYAVQQGGSCIPASTCEHALKSQAAVKGDEKETDEQQFFCVSRGACVDVTARLLKPAT